MPRIDKVRLESYYQQYPSKTPTASHSSEEPPPYLAKTEEKGVIYEPTVVEKEESLTGNEAREEIRKDLGAINTEDTERTIPELLKEIGLRILDFFRGVISNIWNGPASEKETDTIQAKAENTEGPASEKAESVKPPVENRLEQIIAEHDLEQLVRYVTENGEKKPARSTDLLTIYNRYGRVNRIDPSDRKKILEGNFHDIQL